MLDQRNHRVHRGEVGVVVGHADSGVVVGVPDPHRQGQYDRGEGIREDTNPLVMMTKSLWRQQGGHRGNLMSCTVNNVNDYLIECKWHIMKSSFFVMV